MTTVRKTILFTSPCLNSAILAKYPSSTPRGEPLKLTKRTDPFAIAYPRCRQRRRCVIDVSTLLFCRERHGVISKCMPLQLLV